MIESVWPNTTCIQSITFGYEYNKACNCYIWVSLALRRRVMNRCICEGALLALEEHI